MALAAVRSKAVVLLLFIHCLLLLPQQFSVRSLYCFAVPCVLSSFTIISLGKRELVDLNAKSLLSFFDPSSRCHGLVCSM